VPYLFEHLDTVRETLGCYPFGLITDIDGTISEIAPSPVEARVSASCREQLAALTARLALVAAISGRPAAEARDMVGVDGIVYIGNHGLERWQDGEVHFVEEVGTYPAKAAALRDELASALSVEGIALENKTVGLSIHYRRSPAPERARQAILEALAASPAAKDFKVAEGKMVVELRPRVQADKGAAVASLVEDFGLRGGVYLGDDVTDVDAFSAMHRQGLTGLGVAVVGAETPTAVQKGADFTLNGVPDVERFLEWLAGAAPAPPTARPRP